MHALRRSRVWRSARAHMCVEIVDLPPITFPVSQSCLPVRRGVGRCYKVSMAALKGTTDLVLRAEPSLVRGVLPVFA